MAATWAVCLGLLLIVPLLATIPGGVSAVSPCPAKNCTTVLVATDANGGQWLNSANYDNSPIATTTSIADCIAACNNRGAAIWFLYPPSDANIPNTCWCATTCDHISSGGEVGSSSGFTCPSPPPPGPRYSTCSKPGPVKCPKCSPTLICNNNYRCCCNTAKGFKTPIVKNNQIVGCK